MAKYYSQLGPSWSGVQVGTICMMPKDENGSYYAPDGWQECNGRSLNPNEFLALYQIIGNTYGGNASAENNYPSITGTFNVPDLRDRRPIGTGRLRPDGSSPQLIDHDSGDSDTCGSKGGQKGSSKGKAKGKGVQSTGNASHGYTAAAGAPGIPPKPWTTRALRDDAAGDGGERKRGRGGGRKGGAKSTGKKKSVKAMESEASERLRAVARKALESTKEATRLKAEENARFMETRNFAGKMVEVETEFVEGTKEAKAHTKRVEMLAKGGIDAVLAELMQPKKLTVMDKTKADWRNVKDGDSELQEDLQHHQRGGRTYREQQDFLQQADFREYELERDARLAANSKRGAAR